MYQVIDKFAVGSSYAVSLKGDAALLKNGIKLIDENAFITITENYESMNDNKMVPENIENC